MEGIVRKKACTTCRLEKPLDEFPEDLNNNDKHSYICSDCTAEGKQAKRKIISKKPEYKKCKKCLKTKEISEFSVNFSSKDGYAQFCSFCAGQGSRKKVPSKSGGGGRKKREPTLIEQILSKK